MKSNNILLKTATGVIVPIVFATAALAQSFNGAGRMNPNSPTGWGANPNSYAGTPYANPYNNGYGFNRFGGVNPYFNNGGVVYPFGNPYINPVAMGNGFYAFNGGGVNVNLWRAPSGYYYPWGGGVNTGFSQTVYIDQSNGAGQAVAKQPPLAMQFTDMGQYLDDARKNNKVSEADYESLKRRLKDIQSKERSYRVSGDGYLEEGLDSEVRQNLKDLSREMNERVKL